MKTPVISGNFRQYRRWLTQSGLNPKDYKFINTVYDLMGMDRSTKILLVGAYQNSPIINHPRLLDFETEVQPW